MCFCVSELILTGTQAAVSINTTSAFRCTGTLTQAAAPHQLAQVQPLQAQAMAQASAEQTADGRGNGAASQGKTSAEGEGGKGGKSCPYCAHITL